MLISGFELPVGLWAHYHRWRGGSGGKKAIIKLKNKLNLTKRGTKAATAAVKVPEGNSREAIWLLMVFTDSQFQLIYIFVSFSENL